MELKKILLEELAEINRQKFEKDIFNMFEQSKDFEIHTREFELDNIRIIALQKRELDPFNSKQILIKKRLLLDHSGILKKHLEKSIRILDLCQSTKNLIIETILVKSLSKIESNENKIVFIPLLVNLMNIAGLWSLTDTERVFRKLTYPNLFCLASGEKLTEHGYFKREEYSAEKKDVKDTFRRKAKTARKSKSLPGSFVLNNLLDDSDTVENYIEKNVDAFSYYLNASQEKSSTSKPVSNTQRLNKLITDFIDTNLLVMNKNGIIRIKYLSYIDDMVINPDKAYELFGVYVDCDLDMTRFIKEFGNKHPSYDYRKIIGIEFKKIEAYINELINDRFALIRNQITIIEPEKLNLKMFHNFE